MKTGFGTVELYWAVEGYSDRVGWVAVTSADYAPKTGYRASGCVVVTSGEGFPLSRQGLRIHDGIQGKRAHGSIIYDRSGWFRRYQM